MSERYSRLFALSGESYTPGAPVTLAAGALLKDNQTGKVLTQLKLRSISPKPIKAAKVQIIPMDTVGRPLGEPVEHAYLDLSVSRNVDFGQKSAILLPDAECRRFSARVTEVAFGDNTVWSSNGEWKPLPYARPLQEALPDVELYKQYRLTYGNQCRYLPLEHEDLWYCGCGALNRKEEGACHHCGLELFRLKTVDWAALDAQKNARVAAEQAEAKRLAEEQAKADAARRAEEARQQEIAAAKAKKKKKTAAICAVLAVVVCAAAYVVTQIILPAQAQKEAYAKAQELFEQGKYEEAIHAFTALGEYEDSAEMIFKSKYDLACAAFDAEEYMKAEALFWELGSYQDSAQRAETSATLLETHNTYLEAIAAFNKGDYATAILAFDKLNDYKDSAARLESAKAAKIETTYNNALAALAAGDYLNAKNLFKSLNGYKDSIAKIEEASAALLESMYKDAVSLYLKKDYKAAYQKFVSLEDYKDSSEKRLACIKSSLRSAKVGGTAIIGSTEWKVLQCKNNTYTLITLNDQDSSSFVENFLKSRNSAEKALFSKGPYLPSRQDVKTYSLTTYLGMNTSMLLSNGWLWLGNVIDTPHAVGFQPLSYFMLQIDIGD